MLLTDQQVIDEFLRILFCWVVACLTSNRAFDFWCWSGSRSGSRNF